MEKDRTGGGAKAAMPSPCMQAPVTCRTLPSPPRKELRDSSTSAAAWEPPTDHDEDLPVDVSLDVDAATAFCVVSATEAGDVHHTALMDVHHAGCEGREKEA